MRKSRIGNALPMGATVVGSKTVQFVTQITGKKDAGIVLYDKKNGEREVLPFTSEFQIGNMYSMVIEDIDPSKYSYNFIENGVETVDPYAKVVLGNEVWGSKEVSQLSAGIGTVSFDWEEDRQLMTPYENSVFYQLHVRGFTKHISSQVKKKGTFEGICEKIPHLQELGITAIELMPAYEFLEYEKEEPKVLTMEYVKENYAKPLEEEEKESKINYWGYKDAYYFAPKASYSASKNPALSFKKMVKELHKAGIEVVMQFYFAPTVARSYILEVLKYWVQEYHIDGAHLLGVGIPVSIIAAEPALWNTKLMYEGIAGHEVYGHNFVPAYKNLASYNEGYMYALRRFLKGDIGTLQPAFQAMMSSDIQVANMIYLTNYNTFTLKDMVSFDRKHNEENGEEGRDGNNNNFSWNCGMEGPTRKKNIVAMREKQMRNAITLLMLSKGTPVIVAGDEFGNSQNGNNNPYCQDNAISWLNWKDLTKHQEHFEYTKKMIALVKEQKLLKKQIDKATRRTGVEYPYLSYHGTEAWKLDWSAANKEAGGILYYGDYYYIFIAVNMHWEETALALPNIPGKHKWELLLDTAGREGENWNEEEKKKVYMSSRSIKVITAKGSKSDFDESLSAF